VLKQNIRSMPEDKPDAAFHEKKDKNKKTQNFGGGQKLRMKMAIKHKKPLTSGSKKKKK